jgi:hypothetical protein
VIEVVEVPGLQLLDLFDVRKHRRIDHRRLLMDDVVSGLPQAAL